MSKFIWRFVVIVAMLIIVVVSLCFRFNTIVPVEFLESRDVLLTDFVVDKVVILSFGGIEGSSGRVEITKESMIAEVVNEVMSLDTHRDIRYELNLKLLGSAGQSSNNKPTTDQTILFTGINENTKESYRIYLDAGRFLHITLYNSESDKRTRFAFEASGDIYEYKEAD